MTNQDYIESVSWLAERAREDFMTYVTLFKAMDTKFVMGDLHRFLIGLIQGIEDGTMGRRHAVSVPPQHGKSSILSKEAASWMVGRTPDLQVAITGYSFSLTTDFSNEIRARIQHPLYQLIFPGVRIRSSEGKAHNWRLNNGSGVIAKSVGSKLTGRKVDRLIIDDPHAGRAEAESKVQRDRVKQWYFGDCVTRLSPDGTTVVIGTRFHPNDLIGTLTDPDYIERMVTEEAEEEIFTITNLSAIAGPDDVLQREEGEPLFPEIRHKKFLNAVRATIPSYEWDSQYQGVPRIASTNIIDTDMITMVNDDDIPYDELEIVRGWDLALTEKQTSDWSAGAMIGCKRPDPDEAAAARAAGLPSPLPDLYILDMVHVKMNWTKLRSKINAVSLADLDELGVARIGMEAVLAFEIALLEIRGDLKGRVVVEKRNPKNKGKKNQSSKLMRAQPWVNLVEAGRVFMKKGKWNRELIAEMLTFPDGDHDDQIDGITVAYETLFFKHRLLIC